MIIKPRRHLRVLFFHRWFILIHDIRLLFFFSQIKKNIQAFLFNSYLIWPSELSYMDGCRCQVLELSGLWCSVAEGNPFIIALQCASCGGIGSPRGSEALFLLQRVTVCWGPVGSCLCWGLPLWAGFSTGSLTSLEAVELCERDHLANTGDNKAGNVTRGTKDFPYVFLYVVFNKVNFKNIGSYTPKASRGSKLLG